jgi:hypothetical protein
MPEVRVAQSSGSDQTIDPAWSAPENISSSLGRAVNPVVLAGAGAAVHVLWEENDRIFHAMRRAGQWGAPQAIATGQRPAAGLAADGTLHVVFSNQFADRCKVFYVARTGDIWSLPRLVSKTPGMSTFPSLAIDRAGVVHAAWADTSPGYSVVYHGWLETTWLNEPVSNARGIAPVLALDGAVDELHLVYQSSGINSGPCDIYHLQGQRYNWSLPENISISPEQESLEAAIACASDGSVHLAWQEHAGSQAHIRYVGGRRGSWSAPLRVSDVAVDAREPALLITQALQLSLAWREDDVIVYSRRELPAGVFLPGQDLVSNPNGLNKPALAGSPDGELNLAWSGWSSTSERDVFYSQHMPLMRPKVFLPGIVVRR